MTFLLKTIATLVIALNFLVIPTSEAQADMLVMPPFIMFEDRDRLHDIALINTGNTAGTYRITWIYYKQKEEGGYELMDTPLNPEYDHAKMIVFSPKQVTLPPGGRQRVRMSLRKPPGLPNGEYRAHMQMQRIELTSKSETRQDDGLTAELDVRVGFAVPVVIRQGGQDVNVTISNPQFIEAKFKAKDQRSRLQVTLNRSGTHGTIGRLRAYWTPPGGDEKQIGALNNVNIYSELDRRIAQIALKEGTRVVGGQLRIVYEGDGADKGTVFDELVVPVGQ